MLSILWLCTNGYLQFDNFTATKLENFRSIDTIGSVSLATIKLTACDIIRNANYSSANEPTKAAIRQKFKFEEPLEGVCSKVGWSVPKSDSNIIGTAEKNPDWEERLAAAEKAVLPPLGLLLLGFMVVWAVRGFRP